MQVDDVSHSPEEEAREDADDDIIGRMEIDDAEKMTEVAGILLDLNVRQSCSPIATSGSPFKSSPHASLGQDFLYFSMMLTDIQRVIAFLFLAKHKENLLPFRTTLALNQLLYSKQYSARVNLVHPPASCMTI